MSSAVVDETMSSPTSSAVKAATGMGMPVLSASASTATVNTNGVGDGNAAAGTYEKQRTLSMSLSTASAPSHHPHQPSLAMAPAAFAQLSPQQQQQYYQQPQQQPPASFRPAASTDALTDNMDKLKITQQLQQQQLLQQSSSTTQAAQPAPVADASSATVSSTAATASSSSSSSSSGGGSSSNSNKGKQVKSISYAAERVIGNGSFGVVYQASVIETGETVAIKKVLQDRRFKNRELQIMGMLDHPDVITLRHCFYSKGEKPDEIYLNLVMEYIPETIYRTIRNHTKAGKLLPIVLTKIYMFQILRSVAYIHSIGVSHRDIKPQNLLLNSKTHQVKLCDFGSAKMLVPGEPNVSYICSRYYRAPELVFEATQYSCAIDIWSVGCVFAEMMLGTPLFPGESGVDQLIEIIKILGTPSREEIHAMNPNHQSFKFPQIKSHPWPKVFRGKAPDAACDLVAAFLKYDPKGRLDPLDALAHEFFDELRDINAKLPNGKPVPNIFNFTENELRLLQQRGCLNKVVPKHVVSSLKWPADVTPPNTN